VVACLGTFFESSGLAAEGALIAGSVSPEERVSTRAYLRVMTNIGWALGALVSAVALVENTRVAYVAVILGAAACYLVSTVATLFVPAAPPVPRKQDRNRWIALRDRPYLVLTAGRGHRVV
jgi:MFS family permease